MTEEQKRYRTQKIQGVKWVSDSEGMEVLDAYQCVCRLNAYESRVKELEQVVYSALENLEYIDDYDDKTPVIDSVIDSCRNALGEGK